MTQERVREILHTSQDIIMMLVRLIERGDDQSACSAWVELINIHHLAAEVTGSEEANLGYLVRGRIGLYGQITDRCMSLGLV